jgi:hypothetical protein
MTLPDLQIASSPDIAAATDLPLFDNFSMDGFAVRSADTVTAAAGSNLTLSVVADIPAGSNPQLTLAQGQAVHCKTDRPSRFGKPAFTDSGKCFTNYPRWCKMRAC